MKTKSLFADKHKFLFAVLSIPLLTCILLPPGAWAHTASMSALPGIASRTMVVYGLALIAASLWLIPIGTRMLTRRRKAQFYIGDDDKLAEANICC